MLNMKYVALRELPVCVCVCEQAGGGMAQALLCGSGGEHFCSSAVVPGEVL